MGLTAADAGAQATAARASARTDARIDGNMTGVASARKSPTGRYPDEVGPLPGGGDGVVDLEAGDAQARARVVRHEELVVLVPLGSLPLVDEGGAGDEREERVVDGGAGVELRRIDRRRIRSGAQPFADRP